ncbi:MAG: hypothetical protein ACRBBW_16275 [Cellvibrionaceae bacterium]
MERELLHLHDTEWEDLPDSKDRIIALERQSVERALYYEAIESGAVILRKPVHNAKRWSRFTDDRYMRPSPAYIYRIKEEIAYGPISSFKANLKQSRFLAETCAHMLSGKRVIYNGRVTINPKSHICTVYTDVSRYLSKLEFSDEPLPEDYWEPQ